jgi:hypothetical protein
VRRRRVSDGVSGVDSGVSFMPPPMISRFLIPMRDGAEYAQKKRGRNASPFH